ncbi:MAG: hypothetical protein QOH21_2554 [Acidobacteriota bacterium]|nr:hypothetical protein [Acidobacteriota bacterium]
MKLTPIELSDDGGVADLALDGFPVIDDFSVRISEDERHTVDFFSAAHGRVAGFPAWEHADRDLRHFTPADVPLGTAGEPYEDRDEGWRILLFEHAGWIYVLEGDDPGGTAFAVYFRVPRERYLYAWAALIDFYNPITPLDETDDDA